MLLPLLVRLAFVCQQALRLLWLPTLHPLYGCPITGYIATGNPTATGSWPRVWVTAAVDPQVIPLGSTLRISTLPGALHAEDTGGAVHGCHVDVFVPSTADAAAITTTATVLWWR